MQTQAGARKMSETIRTKYGETEDGKSILHMQIGALGGKTKTTKPKGFAADRERAREAGRKGGTNSRRNGKKLADRRQRGNRAN